MAKANYATPPGGLPPQGDMVGRQAIFTESYALIPGDTMTDIVTSLLPGWRNTRAWVIARPLTGFAETFSQTIVEIAPGGGSDAPEPDTQAQAALFVVAGQLDLRCEGKRYLLDAGGYAYVPAGTPWSVESPQGATFHWVRKRWEPAPGIEKPEVVVSSDAATPPSPMPDTDGRWATTRFVDPNDLRHDMHVNIVTFEAPAMIPFPETHVMEHGLYVLEGEADYLLNRDWHRVGPGDFMWLRAFCPQACRVLEGRFRYLLYKDVNRLPKLW